MGSVSLLVLSLIATGTAALAQSNMRGGGRGGLGGASELAGKNGATQGVIDDADGPLDVRTQRRSDTGGGLTTDETGSDTCTGSGGREIPDYGAIRPAPIQMIGKRPAPGPPSSGAAASPSPAPAPIGCRWRGLR